MGYSGPSRISDAAGRIENGLETCSRRLPILRNNCLFTVQALTPRAQVFIEIRPLKCLRHNPSINLCLSEWRLEWS